jgi:hypothetical protein
MNILCFVNVNGLVDTRWSYMPHSIHVVHVLSSKWCIIFCFFVFVFDGRCMVHFLLDTWPPFFLFCYGFDIEKFQRAYMKQHGICVCVLVYNHGIWWGHQLLLSHIESFQKMCEGNFH